MYFEELIKIKFMFTPRYYFNLKLLYSVQPYFK